MSTRLLSFGLIGLLLASSLPGGAAAAEANDVISRAEFLQILLEAQDHTRTRVELFRSRHSSLPLFVDTDQNAWYAPYAEAAFMLAVTTGFPDRALRPNEPIPIEEAITLVMRAYRVPGERLESDTQWFAPTVRAAIQRNVVPNPYGIGVGQATTRGLTEEMVHRMTVIQRENLIAYPVQQAPVMVSAPQQRVGSAMTAGVTQEFVPVAPVQAAQPNNDQSALSQYASHLDFAITIPRLGIKDLPIFHPNDPSTQNGLLEPLKNGVGHLFSYPGRGGKIMVYGHSSGYSWDVSQYTKIFRTVNKLQAGDRIYVTHNGSLYEYSVTGRQTISPTDASPFAGSGEELILYTCWPPESIKQRLIVRAIPVQAVALQ